MPVLHQLSKKEVLTNFTHKGLMFGIVPIYINDPYGHSPAICTRNWVPEFTLDILETLWQVLGAMHPDNDTACFFKVTCKIDGKPLTK